MTTSPPSQVRGRSIIAGAPLEGQDGPLLPAGHKFYALDPQSGRELPTLFLSASDADINRAAGAAHEAFHAIIDRPAADRALLLDTIATHIEDLGQELLGIASDETGLGPSRLATERTRTLFTLRMFADAIRRGEWLEAVIDTGNPHRQPTPKPDLRRMLRPLGPVAVFGAGNFPLAYSTAGGDTASALAAGCPVIVKGHPGHPGTGELVAHAIAAAVKQCHFPPGTFSFLHAGGDREMAVGEQLVKHPAIRAVGFTGSLGGGMALDSLARERPDPIPVFAEMGSTNPVFILPGALKAHAKEIAEYLAQSATISSGQMCTCPGLIFGPAGAASEALLEDLRSRFETSPPLTMLNPRTRSNYEARATEVSRTPGVSLRAGACESPANDPSLESSPIRASAALFQTSFETFRSRGTLRDEIFGPAAILISCSDEQQILHAAAAVQGSLTGTIWAAPEDAPLARRLQRILEQRVGRIIFNGVPTGVEVANAMVHGGPYPATNQPHSTAVGLFAIRRWVRPVCYQNAPDELLPPELQSANPLGIPRLVNGNLTSAPLPAGSS